MKILKIVGIVLGSLIALVLIAILLQPAEGHISKSIVINAPDSVVFNEVNGFKTFNKWSAWAKMDPEAKYTFEGPETGVGAKMNWDGPKIGIGSQWITESIPNKSIKCGLSFAGMGDKFQAGYLIEPAENGTKFTWTYDGPNSGLSGKLFWLVASSGLAKQYEEGLVDFKNMIEAGK